MNVVPRRLELTDQERSRRVGWGTARRAAGYFRPYLLRAGAVVLFTGAIAGLGLIPALMMKQIFDVALPGRDSAILFMLAGIWIISQGAVAGAGVAQQYLADWVAHRVMFDVQCQLYAGLQRQSLRFFSTTKAGEITARMVHDASGIQQAVRHSTVAILTALLTALTTLLLMFRLQAGMAAVSLLALPLFVLPTRRVGQIQQRLARVVAAQTGVFVTILQETLSIGGVILSKTFGRQDYEMERFREKAAEVRDLSIRRYVAARWLNALLTFLGGLGPALLILAGGLLYIRGQVSVGTIVAFGLLLGRLYAPAGTLANSHVQIMGALALFDRIFEYLDLSPEIQEAPAAVPLNRIQGHIRFADVSFRYGADAWVLRHISLDVHPGELVALVGRSGAGKSTLTYLIPRLYDVAEGTVEIDGYDVRRLSFATLQRAIGVVTQDPILFHATIRDNLRYARPTATAEEIVNACRAAHIHDAIERLSQRYDTVVGERGFQLSGGEKQRLAMARVLLKDPPILILDEATSHLDAESEARVQAALERAWTGRTVLVIAHRLSTILRADLILVLQNGQIVERGRHEALLAQGGVYARLFERQFRGGLAAGSGGTRQAAQTKDGSG